MSAFNAAMSINIQNALVGTYPLYQIDYSKAQVSRGTLPGALNPTAATTVPGEIEYTWDNNSDDTNAMPDDKVLLVVYNPAKQHAVTLVDSNTRVSGSQTITVPATFAGDEVKCYISFQNASQSVLSNSRFAGSVMV